MRRQLLQRCVRLSTIRHVCNFTVTNRSFLPTWSTMKTKTANQLPVTENVEEAAHGDHRVGGGHTVLENRRVRQLQAGAQVLNQLFVEDIKYFNLRTMTSRSIQTFSALRHRCSSSRRLCRKLVAAISCSVCADRALTVSIIRTHKDTQYYVILAHVFLSRAA